MSTQTPGPRAPLSGDVADPYGAMPAKSFLATWLFSWLLGFLGVDRFYLGKVGTGLVKLLTVGGFGVWWLIDLVLTLAGEQRDKAGRLLPDYEQHKNIALIVTAAGVLLWVVLALIGRAFAFVPAGFGPMHWWDWR